MSDRKKRVSTNPKQKQPPGTVSATNLSKASSTYPSYSRFQLTYPVVCRQRYHRDKLRYNKQFQYELKMLELMQNSAYDSMRFHRHVAITTLWPPLHTKKEIDFVLDKFFRLPDKQQRRLHEIMNAPVH
ncbi:uncharacterized protein LOC129758806 [Uranotaenia lowii]|uniref:uncharacterized protein LOC129758806 n=1 Tax=Uranotaenia lowii TaxID=190385 RepID=UPI002478451C|nr:uncharacterized protein LOC129758806 [Uranotaenia lowii]